jgi:hypothetical protein
MKLTKLFTTAILGIALMLQFAACQDGAIAPIATGGSSLSDEDQMRKLIAEDETINSFEANYNEEEAMSLAKAGLSKEIYPIRVGHRMKLVNRDIDIEINEDSAFAHVTNTFEGILYIAASFEEYASVDSVLVDTIVEKEFSAVTTHNVIFAKRDYWHGGFFGGGDILGAKNGGNSYQNGGHDGIGPGHENGNRNGELGGSNSDKAGVYDELDRWAWKIVAISLVEGGTGSPNIDISKVSLTLPDGEEIVVESPNDYYLYRIPGRERHVPNFTSSETILLKVEVQSAYSDPDFVSLTFGALRDRRYNRQKMLLGLVSEEFDGQFYSRVYQTEWVTRPDRGPKHAVIRAVPKQVVFDDEAIVEANSWGVPYIVN